MCCVTVKFLNILHYQTCFGIEEVLSAIPAVNSTFQSSASTSLTLFISEHVPLQLAVSKSNQLDSPWLLSLFSKCNLDFRLPLSWLTSRVVAVLPHLSLGIAAPLSWTTVGNKSMLLVGSCTCLPPEMRPSQWRIPGTRIPPSQFVDFPAARRTQAWKATFQRGGSQSCTALLTKRNNFASLDWLLADMKEHSRQLIPNKTLRALWISSAESKKED